MSRYLLLVLLNVPIIVAGILSALTQYKMKKSSYKTFMFRLMFWVLIASGLIAAEPLYQWLYSRDLTQTEPLSLFDVIQITALVVLAYFTHRNLAKADETERRLNDLHQELSIKLSKH